MSSREFLTLLSELPEASRYKGALRGMPYVEYEWSAAEYREARIAKQLIALSPPEADPAAGPYRAALFSPLERYAIDKQEKEKRETVSRATSRLHAGLYAKVPDAKVPERGVTNDASLFGR